MRDERDLFHLGHWAVPLDYSQVTFLLHIASVF